MSEKFEIIRGQLEQEHVDLDPAFCATSEDPLRSFVKSLRLDIYDTVGEPIAANNATTHGSRTLSEFAELKRRESLGELRDEEAEYFRYGTPVTRRVESALAELEGGESATVFRSGMAAISTVIDSILPLSRETAHIIVGTEGYRQTRNILDRLAQRGLVDITVVPMNHFSNVAEYLKPNTKAIFFETPSNPYLRVIDVAEVKSQIQSAQSEALLIVDHTFASPINQRPLEQGADLVVPSLTKYIGGNNQVGAGAVIGQRELVEATRELRSQQGNIAHDSDCLGVELGLETHGNRVAASNANGMHVANLLSRHPLVTELWYPGHPSHENYEIAQRQMSGFGGVVSFRIKARDFQDIAAFSDAFIAASPKGTYIAPSFGGDLPLLSVVTVVSHFQQTAAQRLERGIPNDLIRLSVGTVPQQQLTDALEAGFAALADASSQRRQERFS